MNTQNWMVFLFVFGCTTQFLGFLLVPHLGTEPGPLAVKARSLNHWIAREFSRLDTFEESYLSIYCAPAQSSLTVCNPMDCSSPGSSVHGIFPTRILEWVAMPSSRGSAQPRDWTHVSCVSCIAGGFFTHWVTGDALLKNTVILYTIPELGQSSHSFLMFSYNCWGSALFGRILQSDVPFLMYDIWGYNMMFRYLTGNINLDDFISARIVHYKVFVL